MVSQNLEVLYASNVNKQMPKVERDLSDLNRHIKFLISISPGKTIDGRDLSRMVCDSMRCATELRHNLETLAEAAASVTRRSQGSLYGPFQSNYRSLLRRIQIEFEELNALLPELQRLASEKLNDPGRHGSAYIGLEEFGVLLETINSVIELITHWSEQRIGGKLK